MIGIMQVLLATIALAATTLIGAFSVLAGPPPSTQPSIGWRYEPLLPGGPHPDRQIEMLSRQIGQMLMIGFVGTGPGDPAVRQAAGMIAAGQLGGVILFGDNVVDPRQLAALTDTFRAAAGSMPPFIAVDQEGGSIQRLTRRKGFQPLPSARSMARKSPCEAYALYLRTGEELSASGINLNFGPVVDLDINPSNPAIGAKSRSYGTDPEEVAAFAEAFIEAHRAAGVLTAAKHFPGHGSAVFDPHVAIVDIAGVWQPEELEPFAALVARDGLPMVMVGHLIHPRFSDGDRPTSLSRRTITEELRERLGFTGIVVTDDLGMDAVAKRYQPEQAAEMAVRAGADLLIFAHAESKAPGATERIIAALAGAVAAGRIPEGRIASSHARLVSAREALAGHRSAPVDAGCPDALAASPDPAG